MADGSRMVDQGKVEPSSNVLKELGHDPLLFYEEPPERPVSTSEAARECPYMLITGGNLSPMFHSEKRSYIKNIYYWFRRKSGR
ncbi:MAG: hypothetical protein JW882_15945 [Deltaproteobacteria bacterium]|nr:hypothetical protein [Deltaproteobacteria bacterium]